MNYFQYYAQHVIPTGLKSFNYAFQNWADYITGNYKDYISDLTEDPEADCRDWFWSVLGEDNVYPKEFIEYLENMVEQIDQGEIQTIPFDFDSLDSFVGLEDDDA
jgi:hypothetical protein